MAAASLGLVAVISVLDLGKPDEPQQLAVGGTGANDISVDEVTSSLGENAALLDALRRPVVVAIDDGFMVRADDETAMFSSSSNSWRRVSRSPLPAIIGQSGIWTGEEVLFAGGAPASGGVSGTEVAAYNPEDDRWRMLDPLPEPRKDALGFFVGGRAVLAGGSAPEDGQFSSRVLVGGDGGWGALDATHSVVAAAAVGDDRLVVVGFGNDATDRDVLHASVVVPAAMSITSLPDLSTTVDGLAFSVGVGASEGTVWVAIGGDGSLELHTLDDGAETWSTVSANDEAENRVLGRNRYSSAASGALVVGKESVVSLTPHDVFRLDASSARVVETAQISQGCEEATTFALSDAGSRALFWVDFTCSFGPRLFLADLGDE